ncbi:MAG: bifunctional phosphoribosylaminoimidazolecarboxamide formyltransferase/IMP cyclohydrolase [Planctomycetota bacterium]
MERTKIRRALVSVSDKAGIDQFAKGLAQMGVEILSTGGTAALLSQKGVPVVPIERFTGFPEIMDGRVKTLHPKVHGGILNIRDNPEHQRAKKELGILDVDLVAVNLYPFEATVAKPGVAMEQAIENIDIGGPSMIRSAAKNHAYVAVVTDPSDYETVLQEMRDNDGALGLATRQKLARKAFALTARYDAAISRFLNARAEDRFPGNLTLSFALREKLRYGENPAQEAAFYVEPDVRSKCVAAAKQLSGKELSYNNILDLDSAWGLVAEFDGPALAVIKHNNPCGAARAPSLRQAAEKAFACDPVSAFGGIVAASGPVDVPLAEFLAAEDRFLEAVIAPAFEPAAVDILTGRPKWGKSVRLMSLEGVEGPFRGMDYRRVRGGLLVQDYDDRCETRDRFQVVSKKKPSDRELADLEFAWAVAKHVRSNAIVLACDAATVGVGAGQMSRIDAAELAIKKAGSRAKGSVLASDAFFPFDDCVRAAGRAGITAVAHPGGSRADSDVLAAADELAIVLVLTGNRHFRH